MARKPKDDLGIRFDAARFLADSRLRQLPLEVVGLYVGVFAVLKDSPRVGFLCDPIETALPMSSVQLALLLGRTQDEVDRGMALILRVQLLTRNADDILYDPEMLRQYEQYLVKSKSGSAGGNTRVARQILLKQTLKQVLEQKSKQTSSKTKEELNINSFPFSEVFENENPIPGGQCAQGEWDQASQQGAGEILLKQPLKQVLKQNTKNPDEILLKQTLKQTLKQIPDAGTQEREEAIARLSAVWAKRLGKRRPADKAATLHATFSDLFDAGITEEAMLTELALGPSTEPRRERGEWPNQFATRMMGQLGQVANSFQGTKEPAADPDARERPFATFHREFCACYPRVVPELVMFWEAGFADFNPPPTLDEYRYTLNCFVNDPRRQGTEKGKPWAGCFAENAGPFLPKYLKEFRRIAERDELTAESKARRKMAEALDTETQGFREKHGSASETAEPETPAAPRIEQDPACEPIIEVLRHLLNIPGGGNRFGLWFEGKTRFTRTEGGIRIDVPNLFLQDWLQKKFGADISKAVEEATGLTGAKAVKFAVDAELFERVQTGEPASRKAASGDGNQQQKVG